MCNFPFVLITVLLISSMNSASLLPSPIGIQPRIIQGKFAQIGQFKYMVSLRQIEQSDCKNPDPTDFKHFCGAALISERCWVISASHCLKEKRLNTTKVRIVVGANHFWRDGDMYKIKKIIIHEKFDDTLGLNDISLLQTKIRVKFGEYVQPIQIDKKWIAPGSEGVFAGFGVTESGLTPLKLKYAELHVISNNECIKMHSFSDQLWIHNTTLCTFNECGSGTYQGDSGGSFAINNKVVGILSWGFSGNSKQKPDQFTRISEFVDWIERKIL